MRWDDVDLEARTVVLRNTKNGFPRTVPLSTRALNVIKDMPRCGPTVFAISANALRLAWERLRRRTVFWSCASMIFDIRQQIF